jgi:hypothetical protein
MAKKVYWILRPRINGTWAKRFCAFASEHAADTSRTRGGFIAHGAKEGSQWITRSSVAFVADVLFLLLWDLFLFYHGKITGLEVFTNLAKNAVVSASTVVGSAVGAAIMLPIGPKAIFAGSFVGSIAGGVLAAKVWDKVFS